MLRQLYYEFSYHRITIFTFAAILPLGYFLLSQYRIDLSLYFLTFWIAFSLNIITLARMNREYRHYQTGVLPLRRQMMAVFRLVMTLIYTIATILVISILDYVMTGFSMLKLTHLVLIFSLNLFYISVYFILRDRLIDILRNNRFFRFTPERSKIALVIFTFFMNLLGFYAMLARPPWIPALIEFVIEANPFSGINGRLYFFLTACTMALLSLLTYRTRRAYLN